MKLPSTLLARLDQALAARPVGPRPLKSRVISHFLKVAIGFNLAIFLVPAAEPTLARLEVLWTATVSPAVPTAPFAGAATMAAEDAWQAQDYATAADRFMALSPGGAPRVIDSGLALRAAALANDPARIERAGNRWNEALDMATLNTTDSLSRWMWVSLSSAESELQFWKNTSPAFSTKTANAYAEWRTRSPGYFAFLGLRGVTDATVIQNLDQGSKGLQNLARFIPEYESWLSRRAEIPENYEVALTLEHEKRLTRNEAGQLAPAVGLASRTGRTPGVTLSPGTEKFMDTGLAEGMSPWEVIELWREHQLLGDEDHEFINPAFAPVGVELEFAQLKKEARVRLQHVKSSRDLKAYFAGWADLANANPGLFATLADPAWTPRFGSDQATVINWTTRSGGESGYTFTNTTTPDPAGATFGIDELESELERATPARFSGAGLSKDTLPDTVAAARTEVQAALADTGLRSVRYPVQLPVNRQTLHALAGWIRTANEGLKGQTGWQGAVLGLKGRLDLVLASAPVANRAGITSPVLVVPGENGEPTRVAMLNVVLCEDSLNTFAHEWTHALDYLGMKDGPDAFSPDAPGMEGGSAFAAHMSRQPVLALLERVKNRPLPGNNRAFVGAWSTLWNTLRAPNIDEGAVYKIQQDQFRDNTLRQLPFAALVLGRELSEVRAGTWTEAGSRARWVAAIPEKELRSFAPEIRQVIAGLEGLSTLSARHAPDTRVGVSPWMNVSVTLGGARYWGGTEEIVARAFAAQIPDSTPLAAQTGRFRDIAMYLPGPTEINAMRPLWHAFFQELNPWWATFPEAPKASAPVAVRPFVVPVVPKVLPDAGAPVSPDFKLNISRPVAVVSTHSPRLHR
jgi:hypothetical protein